MLVRKEQRSDSLDVMFECPFKVLDRRGVIVQIEIGTWREVGILESVQKIQTSPCDDPSRTPRTKATARHRSDGA